MSANDCKPASSNLYREAGVDVEKGDRLVSWLQDERASSRHPWGEIVSGIGGFAALFRPRFGAMKDPLLVTGTDGVGTKVLLGMETGRLEGLGLDLVAMCANDLFTLGARPLFFLDYFATGSLDETQFKSVLTGIRHGCQQCGALLMGGETAEMPGLYAKGHFDLAGFIVGVVDGTRVLGPSRVKAGDVLYALPSSGFHSNGYALLRRWLTTGKSAPTAELMAALMTPTRIYGEIPALVDTLGVETFHALAHITGGGISGNLPRVIPAGLDCLISASKIRTPAWMQNFFAAHGTSALAQEGVFNLGVGMIAVVDHKGQAPFEQAAAGLGLEAYQIGEVIGGRDGREARVAYC